MSVTTQTTPTGGLAGAREITMLLHGWNDGDARSRDALIELTYAELHRIADNRIQNESDDLSIGSTGLVHEAVERLIDQQRTTWQNRGHFFAIAARLMRRLLVDRYRARSAQKRGQRAAHVSFSGVDLAASAPLDLDLLSRTLDRLLAQDPRQAQIVELRFFGGLTIETTAEALSISQATVKHEWAMARAWLRRELAAG